MDMNCTEQLNYYLENNLGMDMDNCTNDTMPPMEMTMVMTVSRAIQGAGWLKKNFRSFATCAEIGRC